MSLLDEHFNTFWDECLHMDSMKDNYSDFKAAFDFNSLNPES